MALALTAVAIPNNKLIGGFPQAICDALNALAAAANIQFVTGAVLVAGVLTVNTLITLTANSKIVPLMQTPGGTLGVSYQISAQTAGAPGTGAFTVTSLQTTGATQVADTSTLQFLIVG